MSKTEFAALHSVEDLGHRWFEKWEHIQVFTHRNGYIPGAGLPENSLLALKASKAAGHNHHEFDIVEVKDGHLVDHDMSPRRTINVAGRYNELKLDDVVPKEILVREFRAEDFAPTSTHSGENTMEIHEYLKQLKKIVPRGTFFPDCRDNDFAKFAALISKHPDCASFVLMFYTFTINSGHDVAKAIDAAGAAPDWRQTVKLVLNLYPDQLVPMAKKASVIINSADDYFNFGVQFLQSFLDAGIHLAGILSQPTGVTLADLNDEEANDEGMRHEVFAEMAVPRLLAYIRAHPQLSKMKIGTGTRGYDISLPKANGGRNYYTYNLWTCNITLWPEGIRRLIKERRATPGWCEAIVKPDFMCMDVPERAAYDCCGVPADASLGYGYPKYDGVERSRA